MYLTHVLYSITLIVVYFFYTLKSWHLDFPCIFTVCQLTLSAGQVGTHRGWQKSFSLLLRMNSIQLP